MIPIHTKNTERWQVRVRVGVFETFLFNFSHNPRKSNCLFPWSSYLIHAVSFLSFPCNPNESHIPVKILEYLLLPNHPSSNFELNSSPSEMEMISYRLEPSESVCHKTWKGWFSCIMWRMCRRCWFHSWSKFLCVKLQAWNCVSVTQAYRARCSMKWSVIEPG